MHEDGFEPRLGRMRAPRSSRGRRYLHAVLAAAMRAGLSARRGGGASRGPPFGRGAAAGRLLGSRGGPAGRRAIIKTRIARLSGKGLGAARAHLRYIQRDGVGRDGAPGGLYSAREDAADGRAFLDRCRGDRHQFRLIVSVEDAAEYADLRPLVRRFMARMEDDLGTALDWVAADHADTLHPHTHVIVRGKEAGGENLVIAREYIARGMRERLCELVALDLGPRTGREVTAQLRREVTAERLTALDRRLLRERDPEGRVAAAGRSLLDGSLRAGRLRKLEALGVAANLGAGRWRIEDEAEATLRALGERGDVLRTMQRALAGANVERAPAERAVFDPASGRAIVGRVLARGLADELRDRHFLLVDGLDGRAHYVDVGAAGAVEPLPEGAILSVSPRPGGARAGDRTIAEVAAASGGRYSRALHAAHDPRASRAFVEAHLRRLEALRRTLRLERSDEGVWTIGADYLARVERWETRRARAQPVAVRVLSPLPLERLAHYDGATWLDEELAVEGGSPARDAGFGREVRAALAQRRAWLLRQGFLEPEDGSAGPGARALEVLRRRELLHVAEGLARETGKDFVEAGEGRPIEGLVRRRLDLASGRFALIEGRREFALVPWRPVLERALGRRVSGLVRAGGTSWTIGRGRSPEV